MITNARSPDLLTIRDARKSYEAPEGGRVPALDGVSLSIAQNEFVTLLGPSGCGKTTLLRAISGFEDLDSGDIALEGVSLAQVPAHRRPVNTVFQNYALFPHLSIADNVGYGLDVAGVARKERDQRVAAALDLVGLGDKGKRRPRQLSGGQQQRVALARAIVLRPRVLLLDEPLSALDKNLRHAMQRELKALQHELGISFVFVTHDQEEALIMSDRIAVMRAGRIQQFSAPTEMYRRPQNLFVAGFIGESNLLAATVLERKNGLISVKTGPGAVVEAACDLDLGAGAAVYLLLRPEDFVLVEGGASTADALAGEVTHQYFVGADIQLSIQLADGAALKVTFRPGLAEASDALAVGRRIRVAPRPNAVHVMRCEASA